MLENITVVFVEPKTAGNIGFMARAMKNFGLKKLILINPCKLSKEAYYHAVHAKDIIKNSKVYESLNKMLEKENINLLVGTSGVVAGDRNIERISVTPEYLAENIQKNTAILFGREDHGLYSHELRMCDLILTIPTSKEYPIMNVSHAAAVIFYELFKKMEDTCEIEKEIASYKEKELLKKEINEVVSKLDMPIHKKRNAIKVFKNIIGRSFLTKKEFHVLMGIFRSIKRNI
ncbi:RNA methyltransferase, TrmH family, group 1 [Methanothermus fervidus DSM 2088]|uniref:RNA methyltransferase, TrmH family, group 1 n=1 Tax=Methanothermus fervidus (strain ATCC 43054 / DSM 2088 / JCM 10308 / V24 S) TaxID=523846 RepID=E3GXK0_METFV|nr:RNA methyltransferase [Methanothermus fervidus]ADP77032.1 RNA methyltransferase, TrmH family, group 1 [Methanothermus fervidus DSM 2088]